MVDFHTRKVGEIREDINKVETVNALSLKALGYYFVWFIKIVYKLIKTILVFFFQPIFNLIEKSKYKYYIYGGLVVFFGLVTSFFIFQHQIKMQVLNVKVAIQEHTLKKTTNQFKIANAEYDSMQQALINNIANKIILKKEKCNQETLLNYMKLFKENNVYPKEEDIKLLTLKIDGNECNIQNIKKEEIKNAKDSILALIGNIEVESKVKEETIIGEDNANADIAEKQNLKDIKEPKSQINTTSVLEQAIDKVLVGMKKYEDYSKEEIDEKYGILDKEIGDENEKYISKSQTPIKAIFCSYGHGISTKDSKTLDNWYVINKSDYSDEDWNTLKTLVNTHAYEYIKDQFNKSNLITERNFIEMINSVACQKLEQEAKNRGIAFYEIGSPKKPLDLTQKIELINMISKEQGYDAKNTLSYELHSNSVANPEKSGIEVFYSGRKMKNNGLQSRDFAITMLNNLKSIHSKYKNGANSEYVVKPDHHSKHPYLWFVSINKTNSILIEYGFKKNLQDVAQMLEHKEEIGNAIAQWVIDFLP